MPPPPTVTQAELTLAIDQMCQLFRELQALEAHPPQPFPLDMLD